MYNKWQSRKWWICVWAMAMSTGLVVYACTIQVLKIEVPTVVGISIPLLFGIIGGYMAANTILKPKGE